MNLCKIWSSQHSQHILSPNKTNSHLSLTYKVVIQVIPDFQKILVVWFRLFTFSCFALLNEPGPAQASVGRREGFLPLSLVWGSKVFQCSPADSSEVFLAMDRRWTESLEETSV